LLSLLVALRWLFMRRGILLNQGECGREFRIRRRIRPRYRLIVRVALGQRTRGELTETNTVICGLRRLLRLFGIATEQGAQRHSAFVCLIPLVISLAIRLDLLLRLASQDSDIGIPLLRLWI